MAIESAHDWKQYYAAERARLGESHLHGLLDAAVAIPMSPGGAVIVPHTRLEITGNQIATAVATIVASGAERVLALGVLHGARRVDAEQVAAARSGDTRAIHALRGVHDEAGIASEEFSLDGFAAMLALAAARVGREIEIIRRYPFLVGAEPFTLPGLDELAALVDDGVALVVTTDPIHHGHAYGVDAEDCLDEHDDATVAAAAAAIDAQLALLSDECFAEFQQLAAQQRSDFRDTGPVLAALIGGGFEWTTHDLALVDYSEALRAPTPSWVAGALITTTS